MPRLENCRVDAPRAMGWNRRQTRRLPASGGAQGDQGLPYESRADWKGHAFWFSPPRLFTLAWPAIFQINPSPKK